MGTLAAQAYVSQGRSRQYNGYSRARKRRALNNKIEKGIERTFAINKCDRVWITDEDWHQIKIASSRLVSTFSFGSGWRTATFTIPEGGDGDIQSGETCSTFFPTSRAVHKTIKGYEYKKTRIRNMKSWEPTPIASMPARIPDPAGASALSFAKLEGALGFMLKAYALLDWESWLETRKFALMVFKNPAAGHPGEAIDHAMTRILTRTSTYEDQAGALGASRDAYSDDARTAEGILTGWLVRASRRYNEHANAYMPRVSARDVANAPPFSGKQLEAAVRASRRYRSFWRADEEARTLDGKRIYVVKSDEPTQESGAHSSAAQDAMARRERHPQKGLYPETNLHEFATQRGLQRQLPIPKGGAGMNKIVADRHRSSPVVVQSFSGAQNQLDTAEVKKLLKGRVSRKRPNK